jgi:hypothetical protein
MVKREESLLKGRHQCLWVAELRQLFYFIGMSEQTVDVGMLLITNYHAAGPTDARKSPNRQHYNTFYDASFSFTLA